MILDPINSAIVPILPQVTNARDWKCVGLIAPRSTFSFRATSL